MKEKIDDLFRDNIDNRSFGYQDEFWGDIASELDAREEKKKRPFLWIFTYALPIILLAGVYYYVSSAKVDLPQADASEIISKEKPENKKSKNVNSETATQQVNKNAENQSIERNHSDIQISKIDDNSIQESNEAIQTNITLDITQTKKQTLTISGENSNRGVNNQANFNTPAAIKNSTESTKLLGLKTSENSENAIEKVSNPSTEKTVATQVIRNPISEFSILEKLPFSKINVPKSSTPKFAKQIIPVSKKFNAFWRFGLIGTGGIDNQEQQFSNWATGIFADYRFTKKLSVDAAILYGEFLGNFGETKSSLQTNYSFGRNRQKQLLTTDKLSLLQVPATLNLHRKRHQFGLGIQGDYVLAAHGRKEVFQEQKTVFTRVASQPGIIEKPTEIPGLNFAGAVNYQYNFNYFSVGARGRYYFKNYLPVPEPNLTLKDLMMFDLTLKVNLK